MAKRRSASLDDAKTFNDFGMLQIDLETLKALLDSGSLLEIEDSDFKDPGPDYSALFLNGKRIGYWPGY